MLIDAQKDDLISELRKRDNWALAEVRELILDRFGVTYSENHVRRLLKSFGMKHTKPYARDYRRPDDAEKVLKNLNAALKDKNDLILGFLGEASPQTAANTQRLWSFMKPIIKKNTTNLRANSFGFYALNGESQIAFKEDSKMQSVCDFLEQIRAANPEKDIVVILEAILCCVVDSIP